LMLNLIRSSLPPFQVSRLGHSVQMMIAAKKVMTYWDDVVERTCCGKENNDKRKRENDPAVMIFHPHI
jgi:hypothetical protein